MNSLEWIYLMLALGQCGRERRRETRQESEKESIERETDSGSPVDKPESEE